MSSELIKSGLKPGDIVRLKSGSRRLTVVEVSRPMGDSKQCIQDGPIKVTVGWFAKGMAYYATFAPEALKKTLFARLFGR